MRDVYLKDGFSARKGIKHYSEIVQKTDLNERTRTKLYSETRQIYEEIWSPNSIFPNEEARDTIMKYIYNELFSKANEDIPENENKRWMRIRSIFDYNPINEVFDFIEGIIIILNKIYRGENKETLNEYINAMNYIFKEENVDYHIINNQITDITSEEEIKSIDETLHNENDVVTKHFQKAMEQLYINKDYVNSVKETIQAVEAMCQIICNNSKATLGEALKRIKKEQIVPIHPTLEAAYSKLYGYVNDAKGVRHANGIGEGTTTEAEAKYMLVSCSAFINYLQEIMN